MNNADYGLTLQKVICDLYGLEVNNWAYSQFNASYNSEYRNEFERVIPIIFKSIKSNPVRLLTYSQELTKGPQTTSPHNFLLENNKTLSIRTMKKSDKVAPRTLGQAGFAVLNDFFADMYGKSIVDKNDIKQLVYYHIHEMMPLFTDYMFQSDYTVFISRENLLDFKIIRSEEVSELSFSRDEFSFTRDINSWTESTTLKYHGKSIAEIQVHKERSFKFRFIVSSIADWLNVAKMTTETLGISAEAAVCNYFGLETPDSFATRISKRYLCELESIVEEAFKTMPNAIRHCGSMPGERGGQSKSSYDFILEGKETLSLKTNKGKSTKICPPEVGQPGAETCLLYFKEFFPDSMVTVTKDDFKRMVFKNIEGIMPIYVEHLFDSDWLLWIYETKDGFDYKTINRNSVENFIWDKDLFSFTKPSLEEWNESNTVKYKGVTIGEFQVHSNRNCFKYRFNMSNLLDIVLKKY